MDLSELEASLAEVNRLHSENELAARQTLEKARRIGELLTEAKAELGHGNWIPWLTANTRISERTARNYMRVHREWDVIKSASVADLTDAYSALANPEHKLAHAEKESPALADPEVRSDTTEKPSSFVWDGKVYPIHPICNLFPWMSEKDQTRLRDDVAEMGLLKPILLFQGQVLDGKLRFRACLDAGVEPHFKEYDGDHPLKEAARSNIKRKSLTAEELKTVMEKAAPFMHKAVEFWPDEE